MSKRDINEIIQLIEQWTYSLSESRLNEQCRRSGIDFFTYMTQQGVNASYLAKLIMDATGYNPRQLWTAADADLLRDAIFRYEASIELAKATDDPKGSAKRLWG